MDTGPKQFADIERLAAADAPDLAEVIEAFVEQGDPTPDEPVRQGLLTLDAFSTMLRQASSRGSKGSRSSGAHAAWLRFLAQTEAPPPPRFQLAELIVKLYERGSEPSRAQILALAADAPLAWGVWGGLKRVYKRAEEAHDFEVLAALATRFDVACSGRFEGDVRRATLVYLKHRAWRYLRGLGMSVPRLYATLAAEMLARVPSDASFSSLHVAGHVVGKSSAPVRRKKRGRGAKAAKATASDALSKRAFPEAWKLSPEPLLHVLEACSHEESARFAIACLRKDFPETLKSPSVAWLDRLAHRRVEAVDELVVEILSSSPELHQAKLREKGLHDAALTLLTSASDKARSYAIAYARAHAKDIPVERLLLLASESWQEETFNQTFDDTIKLAAEMLTSKAPRDLGLATLGIMIGIDATEDWASQAVLKSFDLAEISHEWLIEQIYGDGTRMSFATSFIEKKYPRGAIGAAFWARVLDDPRCKNSWSVRRTALSAIEEMPLASIDPAWLVAALTHEDFSHTIGEMLQKADALPKGIDVERLKGLVFHPKYREVALSVLRNPKLVKPRDLGLGWLLALARRADPALHDFAHWILLRSMKPADFDDGGKKDAGVARLFALASGEKEPEPVRVFAQTYLRCHHPVIGPAQTESKELDLKPSLDRDAFTAARVWPMLRDDRADVRKFALAIAKAELRAWGYHTKVYELGDSPAKEVRTFAYDALLQAGDAAADGACTLTPEELSAAGVLGMAESREQRTREVAMELFRRHYQRLGGAERLGWLMQSADREVQKFAVRLLWEKHRPRALPAGYKPPKPSGVPFEQAGDFKDADALATLLRRTLLALPPGRAKEAADGGPRRRLPASEVKRNVVDIVRDLGLADASFAELVAPILMEMVGSAARGEHEGCLAALAHLRKAHPNVVRFAEGGA